MGSESPLRDPDVKAICFLKKNGDLENCIYFTLEHFYVILKGRRHIISIDQVKSISIGNRLLLGPIVAGGIIFPLATIAFFGNYGNTFLMLILIISGILMMLFGFGGSPALTINTFHGTEHYFVSKTGRNIDNFVDYFNSGDFQE